MAATEATRPAPRLGMAVAPLLTLALFIQYIDRGNIATAAPLIKAQLHLSAAQIGLLISAFYWVYVPGQPLTGWLAHRINAYRTLALGLLLWAVATISTAFAGGFVALLALRLLLGLGESAFWPCSSRLLAQHLPADRLGAFNGLVAIGLSLGPAVGTWVGGNVMAVSGWRASFLIFGVASLLWLVPWAQATRRLDRADLEGPRAPSPSYRQIVARREAWGAMTGQFFGNYAFYFVISWMPLYLVQRRGFSLTEMAGVLAAVYVVQALSNLVTGWVDARWIAAGGGVNRVRKSLIAVSGALSGALVFGAVDNTALTIACLMISAIGFGIGTPALFSIGQTLAGPNAAGKWMGFQNGMANIAGIVGPVITGLVIDATHAYAWTFILAGLASVIGIFCWVVVIPEVKPLDWALEGAA